ncbi:MAG: 30S ribosomal protein S16 [Candidatus Omnitrophota bacterium]|nr:30S ribosomal protein S16 [Candidatus Omnitrophota bacterium]
MSVVIRLKRMGTTKRPHYKIVVCDRRKPRDGRSIEDIGYYNPTKNPPLLEVNKEKAVYWLGKGAQASETVASIFKKKKISKPA